MTCQSLIDAAISMACECPSDSANTADYRERAPYLLASFLSLCAPLELRIKRAAGCEAVLFEADAATYPTEAAFPFSTALAPAAVYYVAALLVLEENESMSDSLFAKYSDTVTAIESNLPAASEPIRDVYGAL